jgi:hypothetical protein
MYNEKVRERKKMGEENSQVFCPLSMVYKNVHYYYPLVDEIE